MTWDTSKPVPVLYFHRGPSLPRLELLAYLPTRAGWVL